MESQEQTHDLLRFLQIRSAAGRDPLHPLFPIVDGFREHDFPADRRWLFLLKDQYPVPCIVETMDDSRSQLPAPANDNQILHTSSTPSSIPEP